MQALEARTVMTAALVLLAAISGVALSALGRPLNVAASTVHKLFAVAAVVFAVLLARDLLKAPQTAVLVVTLTVVSGALFAALFVTGAFLSADRPVSDALRAVHAAIPFLALASILLLAYLGLRRSS